MPYPMQAPTQPRRASGAHAPARSEVPLASTMPQQHGYVGECL